MLIGPAILQYAIGRVAPFSRGPFFGFFAHVLRHTRMHICMRISSGKSRRKKQGKEIINKRKERERAASRPVADTALFYEYLFGSDLDGTEWPFDASLGARQRAPAIARTLFNFCRVIRHRQDVPPSRRLTHGVCSDGVEREYARSIRLPNRRR